MDIILPLELLVREGNADGVEQLADSVPLEEDIKQMKLAEAGIYSAINFMRDDIGGGIDSERVCEFLEQEHIKQYFSFIPRADILKDLVSVLNEGIQANIEAYAQIPALDVLGITEVAGAIWQNINAPGMREEMTALVRNGYSLALNPWYTHSEAITHYFPIVDQWRSLIDNEDIEELMGQAVGILDGMLADLTSGPKKEAGYKTIDNLIALTDRETVSRSIHKQLGSSRYYQKLIDDGKIDPLTPEETKRDENTVLREAIERYEQKQYPAEQDVILLEEALTSDEDRAHLGGKMGQWFAEGKLRSLREIVQYENGLLYDQDIARDSISEGIITAIKRQDYNQLQTALTFPERLIDKEDSRIAGFVTAYTITQETRERDE